MNAASEEENIDSSGNRQRKTNDVLNPFHNTFLSSKTKNETTDHEVLKKFTFLIVVFAFCSVFSFCETNLPSARVEHFLSLDFHHSLPFVV